VEVGDPRRFRSADAFASYTGTAPIPASSAEAHGHPVHHRLNRFGNRRLDAVLYRMAIARLRADPETQAYVARLLAAGKTKRDALRILKRRPARQVWQPCSAIWPRVPRSRRREENPPSRQAS
jgi:transposase